MTADQRLDQLEPLMSESMAILDRHTAPATAPADRAGAVQAAVERLGLVPD